MQRNMHCGWFKSCELHIEMWINYFSVLANSQFLSIEPPKKSFQLNGNKSTRSDFSFDVFTQYIIFFPSAQRFCGWFLFLAYGKLAVCVCMISHVIKKMWFIDYYYYQSSLFFFDYANVRNLCVCEYRSGFCSHRYHFRYIWTKLVVTTFVAHWNCISSKGHRKKYGMYVPDIFATRIDFMRIFVEILGTKPSVKSIQRFTKSQSSLD